MENIPKSLWPLLMSAAEAAAKSDGALTKSISQAAQGVSTWRELLSKGRIWRDEDGANWPQDNTLRSGWQNLLRDKGLPHLVKKYPKLVDPLLASLLETVEQFHQELDEMEDSNEETDPQDEEEEQEDEANNPSTPSDTNDESEDAAADTEDIESSTASTNEVNGDDTEDADTSEREALAEKLMDQLSEQLGDVADAMSAADSAFGNGAGEAMLGETGFGESQGQWRDTLNKDQSEELLSLAKIMRSSPELRELLRNLGRRSAIRGPLHKLPEEIWHEGGPDGVIRSPAAPAEATGVTLSGSWDTMLPSEAQLLAAKSPMLRTLHHARRIEQSLLCYDRSSWLEDDSKKTGRSEIRPVGKAGPLIVCLDTSGSMMGDRELLSKALVVECVRQAHRQRRPCYLYAFSGAGDLKELELDLSQAGFRKVLDFLQKSFGGGTYLEDALAEVATKLQQEIWQNADLLIVTDGELNASTDEAAIVKARAEYGTKVTGLVLADTGGAAMERLCNELYVTGRNFRGEKGLKFPKLRKLDCRLPEAV